jgi:hypothetical protein
MARILRSSMAIAVAITVLTGPLSLGICAASCESTHAAAAVKAPPCHHHGAHAKNLFAPSAGTASSIASSPSQLVHHPDANASVVDRPIIFSPRAFVLPLRI